MLQPQQAPAYVAPSGVLVCWWMGVLVRKEMLRALLDTNCLPPRKARALSFPPADTLRLPSCLWGSCFGQEIYALSLV